MISIGNIDFFFSCGLGKCPVFVITCNVALVDRKLALSR